MGSRRPAPPGRREPLHPALVLDVRGREPEHGGALLDRCRHRGLVPLLPRRRMGAVQLRPAQHSWKPARLPSAVGRQDRAPRAASRRYTLRRQPGGRHHARLGSPPPRRRVGDAADRRADAGGAHAQRGRRRRLRHLERQPVGLRRPRRRRLDRRHRQHRLQWRRHDRHHGAQRLVRRAAVALGDQPRPVPPGHRRRLLRRPDELRQRPRRWHERPLRVASRGRARVERDPGHHHLPRLQPDDGRPGHHAGSGRERREHLLQARLARAALRPAPLRCRRRPRIPELHAARDQAGRRRRLREQLPDHVRRQRGCRWQRRDLRHDEPRAVRRHTHRHDARRRRSEHVQLERHQRHGPGAAERDVLGVRRHPQRIEGRDRLLHRPGQVGEAGAGDAELLRAAHPCSTARHPHRRPSTVPPRPGTSPLGRAARCAPMRRTSTSSPVRPCPT
ncbi:MAG: hypothetical protein FD127_1745 [Acidimicrobiaceae bacterium]|nr:MAG: hypothetical protein FD127_1745 [Acidimicrobiaceae bacterium]